MSQIDRHTKSVQSTNRPIGDWLREFMPALPPQTLEPTIISKKNVLHQANAEVWQVFCHLLDILVKPKSQLFNFEHLATLYQHAQQGHSCLIMMEHYSNFDFPGLMYLLERHNSFSSTMSKHVIPMAAMKLNEDNLYISLFTGSFTHISIFPARRLDELSVVAYDNAELKKAREINMAALKVMRSCSQSGNIILMFPSGTRYKPGDPQTKRVVKAANSFMKRFEYVVFGGIAGNILSVNDPNDMPSDYTNEDTLVYSFSKVHKCKTFRKAIKAEIGDDEDLGQLVNERIEEELEGEHEVAQQVYDRLVMEDT